jgi:hypothetical protein
MERLGEFRELRVQQKGHWGRDRRRRRDWDDK